MLQVPQSAIAWVNGQCRVSATVLGTSYSGQRIGGYTLVPGRNCNFQRSQPQSRCTPFATTMVIGFGGARIKHKNKKGAGKVTRQASSGIVDRLWSKFAQLISLTKEDLIQICRDKSLMVSGTKPVLACRIVAHELPHETHAVSHQTLSDLLERRSNRVAELMSVKKKELEQMCKDKFLGVSGSKETLASCIAEQEIPDKHKEEHGEEEGEQTPLLDKSIEDQTTEESDHDEIDENMLDYILRDQLPDPGTITTGKVLSLMDYGALVELTDSGCKGMIHISEIADEYVTNIEDYLRPGQTVQVLVIKPPDDRQDRLALSTRRLQGLNIEADSASAPVAPFRTSEMTLSSLMENTFGDLQTRAHAIESALVQIGYGPELRRFERSMDGNNASSGDEEFEHGAWKGLSPDELG